MPVYESFTAWDFPAIIIAALAIGMVVMTLLLRAGRRPITAAFECLVCGRERTHPESADWRFCPYCGAPRDAKNLGDMPSRRRSVVDINR